MGKRIYKDNLLWIFCCCGGLPLLGIIKGIIIVIPILLISTFGFTWVAIILLPHDIVLTYRALFKTSIIGINLKILGMLILPIALIAWPIFVFFISYIFGFFYGLFCPTIKTFDTKYDLLFGGFVDVFEDVFGYIKKFWKFNYDSFFAHLREIENRKTEEPFDISFIRIIICLIIAIYGSIVGIVVFFLMWVIKLIPAIFRLYKILFEKYGNLEALEKLAFLILFIIAIILVPVIGILTIFAYIGYGFFGGINCAIEGYKYNLGRGIISIFNYIHKIDSWTNEIIFHKSFSCFPECEDDCKYKSQSQSSKKNIDKYNQIN